jgi:hypothetical protein
MIIVLISKFFDYLLWAKYSLFYTHGVPPYEADITSIFETNKLRLTEFKPC